jgi:hypothetical protein
MNEPVIHKKDSTEKRVEDKVYICPNCGKPH